MLSDSTIVLLEIEQIKYVEGQLVHLIVYSHSHCEILELFVPFGRKKFWPYTSLGSLSLINE